MNRICYIWISWALLMVLTACKPQQQDVVEPTPPIEQPTPTNPTTSVGQPQGSSTSQVIGPEGGSISTTDGIVQLVIPAGALTKATTLTIQPISNYAPNGVGLAYRFLPDGTQFARPAILTIRYEGASVAVNDPDMLRMAYQKTDQRWQEVPDVQVDTINRKITVPMPHFSDWSAYEIAKLELIDLAAGQDHLDLGASTTLEVKQSLLEPLTNSNKQTLRIDYSQMKWSVLGGSGNGQIKATKEKATYTAPANYPAQNPITVIAEVHFQNSDKKVYLLKRLLVGNDYFTGTFGGTAFNWSQLVCTKKDGLVIINGNNGANQSLNIMLNLNASESVVGSYQYTNGFKLGTAFAEYAASYGDYDGFMSFNYPCYVGDDTPPPPIISGGNVTITQFDEVGGVTYIKGYLSGSLINLPGPCPAQLIQKSIHGEFRIAVAH